MYPTEIAAAYPLLTPLLAALLGLLIGSFFNVVIHRLPLMMEAAWRQECKLLLEGEGATEAAENEPSLNLAFPKSRCPHCHAPIKAWQNIPVLSYLLLRGRCANCQAPISLRYPSVELLTGLAAFAIVWSMGLSWQALATLALCWSLLILTVIDIDHQLLPDQITLPLLWLGLLYHASVGPLGLHDAVWGAAAGYLSLWSVYWLFKLVTGKEGMGYGDFKLLAALGAWMGWQMLPLIILLSSVVGAVVGGLLIAIQRQGSKPIPFGPYLAAAGIIALFWGDTLVSRYLQLAGFN